jgi:hypothetical protein
LKTVASILAAHIYEAKSLKGLNTPPLDLLQAKNLELTGYMT